YSQKHFRITEPIINIAMLMVCLPILVCRDPKSMKSAIVISFGVTTACFITTFICKMLATEVFFDHVMPELWAWLPVVIFLPIAFIELDSMKT
ncbi:MAG: LptF/LptG family permease, partial [Planctomycetota bacterium]